jgi:putative tryptophan/tyrosine transport system substrate-binding protein
MNRREFITLLGNATVWPLAAQAQQSMPVIGFLNGQSADSWAHLVSAFREGLHDTGFTDGQNVAIEYRWANGHDERVPALAAELIRRGVALLVTGGGTASTTSAKAATSTIPIVFTIGTDPVKLGFVTSFNKPGGNVTGVSFLVTQLNAKRLGLARQLVSTGAVLGVLIRPSNPTYAMDKPEIEAAAATVGQKLLLLEVASERDFETVFATAARQQVGALLVHTDPFFNSHRDAIVALAARYAVPAIYEFRDFVRAGGLISYGTSISSAYRQAGNYAGRILKGERPADLPVIQSTRFELVINLNTARTLGLEIPPTLLALADEVIE